MRKLGVVPQQLAAGDIYPALEKGTIDAAEWVGPYDDEKLGFVKVAQILLLPRLVGRRRPGPHAHQPRQVERAAEELPGDGAGLRGVRRGLDDVGKYDVLNPQALKRLVAAGAQLRPFPQPVMEACYKAANEIYAEIAQSNPTFKKLLDSLTPFRSDSYQWLQVAEFAFDSFMMRMRTRA